jgi:CheY-like chemotaxis protein
MKILGRGSAVLFLDDSVADQRIVEVSFQKAGYQNKLILFDSYKPLFKYLSDVVRGALRMPEILLLDINMPHMDGFEVQQRIRARSQFKKVPIAFFTTSSWAPQDIVKAKALGCTNFYMKPVQVENYIEVFEDIQTKLMCLE